MTRGGVFGWAGLLLGHTQRLATVTAAEPTEVLRIDTEALVKILEADAIAGNAVMERFASMIAREFTVPALLAQVRRLSGQPQPEEMSSLGPDDVPPVAVAEEPAALPDGDRVRALPRVLVPGGRGVAAAALQGDAGPHRVIREWLRRHPTYGLSFYTAEYYQHIGMSVWRVTQAFVLATVLGVPVGLLLGWSRKFKEYVFPLFETLRPIPILAWVPLAIVMFIATESAVVFLAFLASFFATALNTMLGVESIDESYVRAAYCLGADEWQVFRHVIMPGALPFIFTGLQISIGVSWFSLVAAEMVSGQYGLGYVINTSYVMVRYPTIVIGMVTLGMVGYATSALVRIAGDYLMEWRVRELALAER